MCFPGDSGSKVSACYPGDLGLIPGSGRSPGKQNGYPLQYSCLENSMNRRAWLATVHGSQRAGHDRVTNSCTFHFSRTMKHKNNDNGNLDMPKGSCNMLPFSEKMKVRKKEEEKKSEVAKIYCDFY